jgi:hypothetical protein
MPGLCQALGHDWERQISCAKKKEQVRSPLSWSTHMCNSFRKGFMSASADMSCSALIETSSSQPVWFLDRERNPKNKILKRFFFIYVRRCLADFVFLCKVIRKGLYSENNGARKSKFMQI